MKIWGRSPRSSSAGISTDITPASYAPRAPPPESTSPTRFDVAIVIRNFGGLPPTPLAGICSPTHPAATPNRSRESHGSKNQGSEKDGHEGRQSRLPGSHEPVRPAVHRGSRAARECALRVRVGPEGGQADAERQGSREGACRGPQASERTPAHG